MSTTRTRAEIVADNNKRKERILSVLNAAENYYAQKGDENTVKNIQVQKKNLEENKFSIVVVGEFSAGKSTLLNAMMGRRMLPSFTQETTATVNFLRGKNEAPNNEPGIVYYNDGSYEVLPDTELETIEKFVSTKGEDVANTVNHLDVYLDSEFLKDGVMLVDSPGLNGVAEGHKEITENQIKQSNASIFMFDATRPGSKTDFDTLGNLRENVNKIFILLNKVDMIKEDEGETVDSVIEGVKKNYKKMFPEVTEEPEIYPVSAGTALRNRQKGINEDKYLDKFESALFEFMSSDKKYVEQLRSPIKQVDSFLSTSIQELNENKEALESKTDSDEIHQKIAKLTEEIEVDRSANRDAQREIANKLNVMFKDVTNTFRVDVEKYIESSLQRLEDYEDIKDLEDYVSGFESSFTRKLRSITEDSKEELQSSIEDIVREQYVERSLELSEKLDDINMFSEIKANEKFELPTDFGEVGLSKMKDERAKLEEKIERLKQQANNASDNLAKVRGRKREQDRLEEELRVKEQALERFEQSVIKTRPEVYRAVNSTFEKRRRTGLARVADWIFGEKDVPVKKTIVDDSERRQYDEENSKRLAERKKEILEIRRRNASGNGLEEDYEVAGTQAKRADAELRQAQEEWTRLVEEQKDKLNEQGKRQLRKLKRLFEDYCTDTLSNVLQSTKKNMRSAKKEYAKLIDELINANIEQKIKNKKKHLENLETQLQSSEDERNAQLAKVEEELVQLNEMLEQVNDVKAEVESIRPESAM
ncbi:dynamin family protein [Ligilactobacillus faecis]|uniref:Dynamin family protein n=1 Tax=Ligilactobacillus faecis TaxID=762833 RepID=A0ABV4DME8_9LACO